MAWRGNLWNWSESLQGVFVLVLSRLSHLLLWVATRLAIDFGLKPGGRYWHQYDWWSTPHRPLRVVSPLGVLFQLCVDSFFNNGGNNTTVECNYQMEK